MPLPDLKQWENLKERNNMSYLAVDKDGACAIYQYCPIRDREDWTPVRYENTDELTPWMYLSKSSVIKLAGKELTWEDEPFEITD